MDVKKLKVKPINNYSNSRFETPIKTYKRLFLLVLVLFIISSCITADTFGKQLKEDRKDFKEMINNYTTVK